MKLHRRLVTAGLCLLLVFCMTGQPVFASQENPYRIKNYDQSSQRALFIISPDTTSAETKKNSRRHLDIFGQAASSYWNLDITTVNAFEYQAGQAAKFDVIVISDEFGETLPRALTSDLATLDNKEVVYFGVGGNLLLEEISGAETTQLKPPASLPHVTYKNVRMDNSEELELFYGVQPSSSSGTDIRTPITTNNPDQPAAIRATRDTPGGQTGYTFFPFIVPRYYEPQSYTTAMLDVLHGAFGEIPNYPEHALMRLEDVNGHTYQAPAGNLLKVYKILQREGAPFHIALIERYKNPAEGIDATTSDYRHFDYLLRQMVGRGDAVLVQHGYTHQYQESVSAVGFEFWDVEKNAPAASDSEAYARERVESAQAAMAGNNLPVPDIWETPHYKSGPVASKVFSDMYPLRYEYVPDFGSFPFPVNIDGTIYIPENLGFIENEWSKELPAFKQRVKQLSVFRNPTPSFFWHPWREPSEIKQLTDILQNHGYEFAHAYDLLQTDKPETVAAKYQQFTADYGNGDNSYLWINAGIVGIYGFLIAGAITYGRDRRRFGKYYKLTTRFKKPVEELVRFCKKQRKDVPTFLIFVPARNEGLVITNTIENLAQLDYPKDKYQIVIITDEREMDDGVETLTKMAAARKTMALQKRSQHDFVKLVEVPHWYSGVYGDATLTDEKSTKGRALNYALQTFAPPDNWQKTDLIGVLDADGRLNPHVLKEAAWRRVESGATILQGPVYQVSNLASVSVIGVMAGLELARHHLVSMMPKLLKAEGLQFLAGTNYFIDKALLEEVGGWDKDALVEDAELAVRLYTQKGVSAQALTLPEIEQTPATFKVYRRQRERWARGHFELLGTIVKSSLPDFVKLVFIHRILLSQFRFITDISIPILAIIFLLLGYFSAVFNVFQVISIFLLVTAVVMWDVYGQTYRRLAYYSNAPKSRRFHLKMSAKLFVLMPLFILVQAIPRIDALVAALRHETIVWQKTERTAETTVNQQEGGRI